MSEQSAGRRGVWRFSSVTPKENATPPDGRALAELARRQLGLVTTAQLRGFGLTPGGIAHRVRLASLHRVHRGVYAVGHAALSRDARFLAAVLAVGPDAVLSHRSAAALWELVERGPASVEVTTPGCARSRPGIHVHRVRRLDRLDRTREVGIPVTTVPRTLLDLADVLSEDRLRRVVREAYVRRRVDDRRLGAVVRRAHGRRGAGRLAALLADGPAPTRSELEDRFLDVLRAHGLPRPSVNVRLSRLPRPVEVDFLFAEARLVVETDGARYHDNRIAREADATRQAMLEAAGYRVLRVSWRQVTREPEQTSRRLRAALRVGR